MRAICLFVAMLLAGCDGELERKSNLPWSKAQMDFAARQARGQKADAYTDDGVPLCRHYGDQGLNFLRVRCDSPQSDCWGARVDENFRCSLRPFPLRMFLPAS